MAKRFKTWSDFHHQINQLYHLFISVTLIPFALLFLEIDSSKSFAINSNGVSILLIVLANIGVGYLSWYAWKGGGTQYHVEEDMSIRDKLAEYKKKSIRRFTFLLLAGLIALAGLWIISSYLFVLSYFAILVQYSFLRPSQDRAIRDLRLTKTEREMFKGEELP